MATINVTLSLDEINAGARVGIARQIQNIERGRAQKAQHDPSKDWIDHIEGALGELAVAKWLDRFWSGRLGKMKAADVGPYDVRTAIRKDRPARYRLIIRETDPEDRPFVLVIGRNGSYEIVGWIYAGNGKKPDYWQDPTGERDPAFFVPRSALWDPARLFALDREHRKGF